MKLRWCDLRLLPDQHALGALRLVVGRHREHAAGALPFVARAIDDQRVEPGASASVIALAVFLGREVAADRAHQILPDRLAPDVRLAAAALGFDHADLAVRPDEAARQQQRGPRFAVAALGIEADQRLGLGARGGAECGGLYVHSSGHDQVVGLRQALARGVLDLAVEPLLLGPAGKLRRRDVERVAGEAIGGMQRFQVIAAASSILRPIVSASGPTSTTLSA
jgi:hypothetical protein